MLEEQISVNLAWKRPDNVPYPHVWEEFEKKSKNEQRYKVKIEDLTSDRFEELLDFMDKNYDHHEPLCRAIQLWTDPRSVFAKRITRRKVFEQKLTLIATLNNDQDRVKNSKIVGALLIVVVSKNDPPIKVAGEKWQILHNFFANHVLKDTDPFQIFDSDEYIGDFGLVVAPQYYGLSIGFQLLSCIPRMAQTWNIAGSLILFTSLYSQAPAEKLHFKLHKEFRYDEYLDEKGERILPDVGTPSLKLMKLKM